MYNWDSDVDGDSDGTAELVNSAALLLLLLFVFFSTVLFFFSLSVWVARKITVKVSFGQHGGRGGLEAVPLGEEGVGGVWSVGQEASSTLLAPFLCQGERQHLP